MQMYLDTHDQGVPVSNSFDNEVINWLPENGHSPSQMFVGSDPSGMHVRYVIFPFISYVSYPHNPWLGSGLFFSRLRVRIWVYGHNYKSLTLCTLEPPIVKAINYILHYFFSSSLKSTKKSQIENVKFCLFRNHSSATMYNPLSHGTSINADPGNMGECQISNLSHESLPPWHQNYTATELLSAFMPPTSFPLVKVISYLISKF